MKNRVDILLIHSNLKHLNRATSAEHVDITLSEEETSLPEMINVADESRTDTIETFSLPNRKKVDPEEAWSETILIEQGADYRNKINLRYFIDGVQQTIWIKNIPILTTGEKIPYHAGQVGSVVLERKDRRLSVIKEISEIAFNLMLPAVFVEEVSDIEKVKLFFANEIKQLSGLRIQDTSYFPNPKTEGGKIQYSEDGREIHERIPNFELKKSLNDLNYFRKLHMKWNVRNRALLEKRTFDLLAEYLSKREIANDLMDFCVLDGTLTDVRGKILLNAVGVIKSHRMRFLDSKKHNKAFQLPSFCRTPVFLLGPNDESSIESDLGKRNFIKVSNRASWYLRIRVMEHFIPSWGLLRIEIDPKILPNKGSAELWDEADSLLVNAISQKLIEERYPTSHPDTRWANLLYPIFKCEQYLKSLMIPREVIRHIATTPRIEEGE